MNAKINVTVWNEFYHEQQTSKPDVQKHYPKGIHQVIIDFLKKDSALQLKGATLEQPEHGLGDGVLESTDVLIWWGHCRHDQVDDAIVKKVHQRVLSGMGLIVLHSGHFAKIFKSLMGTGCGLKWREANEKERLWNLEPSHPITQGIGDYFEIEHEEMYGERFDIPTPDELLFVSWFQGGEVFRSGATWRRGHGKIFYFRPGHETYPTYHHPQVQRVIQNAVHWAKPTGIYSLDCPNSKPLEKLT